jgi:hypothetical protein
MRTGMRSTKEPRSNEVGAGFFWGTSGEANEPTSLGRAVSGDTELYRARKSSGMRRMIAGKSLACCIQAKALIKPREVCVVGLPEITRSIIPRPLLRHKDKTKTNSFAPDRSSKKGNTWSSASASGHGCRCREAARRQNPGLQAGE